MIKDLASYRKPVLFTTHVAYNTIFFKMRCYNQCPNSEKENPVSLSK